MKLKLRHYIKYVQITLIYQTKCSLKLTVILNYSIRIRFLLYIIHLRIISTGMTLLFLPRLCCNSLTHSVLYIGQTCTPRVFNVYELEDNLI
jgi:hypothetical protein